MKLNKKKIKKLSSGMKLIPNEITPLIAGGGHCVKKQKSIDENNNLKIDKNIKTFFYVTY
ncbi:hypothetical protein [Pseudoalteromonas sp. HL-AS1]|uniref:hypothetical protein n=1 Tax=Pseudoalteromonas sp. HL-AS1 TaxID=3071081 RepID=UPI002815CE94|nr:hypothetical protein [Pseudoalteromonas sp. HL-AS1]WMS90813.1 hypothetical protein RB214_16820 [Pseudoalteromonas sp. HL-AS1]